VGTGAPYDPLKATVEFRSVIPPVGSVVLENMGDTDLRVWQQGNSWGDSAISFELRLGGSKARITRVALDYTRNVPASVVVPPGSRHEFLFDLSDASWQPASALFQCGQAGAKLRAIYSSGDSPESHEQGVWQGNVLTALYRLR
jgi:hypothetical protein